MSWATAERLFPQCSVDWDLLVNPPTRYRLRRGHTGGLICEEKSPGTRRFLWSDGWCELITVIRTPLPVHLGPDDSIEISYRITIS